MWTSDLRHPLSTQHPPCSRHSLHKWTVSWITVVLEVTTSRSCRLYFWQFFKHEAVLPVCDALTFVPPQIPATRWRASAPERKQPSTWKWKVSDSLTWLGPHVSETLSVSLFLLNLSADFSKDDQLKWQDSSGSAFARGGLRLVDNDIVIPESGLYFVYSQAVFRVTCSYDTYVSHKILRYSDSFDAPLLIMFAIKSVCQDTNRQNGEVKFFEHVYLGGVFQLKKGDRLGTTSYWTLDVQTDSGKTFFGAFAVWDSELCWRIDVWECFSDLNGSKRTDED